VNFNGENASLHLSSEVTSMDFDVVLCPVAEHAVQ